MRSAAVWFLVPALILVPCTPARAAGRGIHGKIVMQDGGAIPDGFTIAITSGGTKAETRSCGGRFQLDLPAPAAPVTLAVLDCSGNSVATGQVSPPKATDTTRDGPADLGEIPVRMPDKAGKVSLLVLRGRVSRSDGQTAPDGTEVSIALARAKLFDSVKTQGGQYSLVLTDLANATGGFKAGDELTVALRLPDKSTPAPVPGKYKVWLSDVANSGACRDVNITYKVETPPADQPKVIQQDIDFGTTTPQADSLTGNIFFLPVNTPRLPDFTGLKPDGMLFTRELNISARAFDKGFPGVNSRFEWFGIRYEGAFTVAKAGDYGWRVHSDDGAKVFVDGKLIIDNDGIHPPSSRTGKSTLAAGKHMLRVDYFQGPRVQVALQLFVTPPGGTASKTTGAAGGKERLWAPSF